MMLKFEHTLPTITIILIALLSIPGSLSVLIISLFAVADGSVFGLAVFGHFAPLILGFIFYLTRSYKWLYAVAIILALATLPFIVISFITYSDAWSNYLEDGWLMQYFLPY